MGWDPSSESTSGGGGTASVVQYASAGGQLGYLAVPISGLGSLGGYRLGASKTGTVTVTGTASVSVFFQYCSGEQ